MGQQFPPVVIAGTADAAGGLTLTYTPRGSGLTRVPQVAVEMADAGSASCKIRRNGALVTPIVPTAGAAGGDPPIWLWPGDILTAEWTGAPAGGTGKMTVFYDLGDS